MSRNLKATENLEGRIEDLERKVIYLTERADKRIEDMERKAKVDHIEAKVDHIEAKVDHIEARIDFTSLGSLKDRVVFLEDRLKTMCDLYLDGMARPVTELEERRPPPWNHET
jgi:hypothetical protein